MTDPDAVNLVLLVFRIAIGGVMIAHGVNHVWGGGKIDGTAAWFGSMGMKSPLLQAWAASLTEMGGGAMLALGLLTPLASAAVIGVMTVAWIIAHKSNGFFIFRPGQGWEYVMVLWACGLLLATVGPGEWSLDEALGLRDDLSGWTGMIVAVAAGVGGALALLAATWRPPKSA